MNITGKDIHNNIKVLTERVSQISATISELGNDVDKHHLSINILKLELDSRRQELDRLNRVVYVEAKKECVSFEES